MKPTIRSGSNKGVKHNNIGMHNRAVQPKPFDNTWPLVLELIFFLSNNVRMSKATEMFLRDHNSNNCTYSGNVCYCMYMVNNDYDKFRSFSRL